MSFSRQKSRWRNLLMIYALLFAGMVYAVLSANHLSATFITIIAFSIMAAIHLVYFYQGKNVGDTSPSENDKQQQWSAINEKYLQRLKVFNRILLCATSDAVYGLDVNGNTTFINEKACTVLGRHENEVLGMCMHDFLQHCGKNKNNLSRHHCFIYQTLKDGMVRQIEGEFFCRKNGEKFPVNYIVTPLEENARVTGVIVIFKDMSVTSHPNYQSNKDYFSMISHELRTPMQGILSYANIGKQKIKQHQIDVTKLENYFYNIELSAHRLLTLLNEILDLSKLESGKMVYKIDVSRAEEIISFASLELEAIALEKDITIENTLSDSMMLVECDKEKIAQVLKNLIMNAIKFTVNSNKIKINVSPTEYDKQPAVLFQVINQSKPIPEDEISKLFDKYSQSSLSVNLKGSSGLGLSICKEIVSDHHGDIWAQSNENGLTVFSFVIPEKHVGEKHARQ